MSKAKAKSASNKKSTRIMVLYGMGEDSKPRAARFGTSDFKLARKAAKLMGLNVYEGSPSKLAELQKALPAGRIYASGSGFVPTVRRKLYDELVSLLNPAGTKEVQAERKMNLPAGWSSIQVGHTVLAQADSAAAGWWETEVESIDGDMLLLRAVAFPEVTVTRHRSAVALLHTADYVAPDPSDEVPPGLPTHWDTFAVEHLVIAQEESAEDGWWEAIIVEIDSDELTLKWRDFPRQPKVKRLRTAVALLSPTPPQQP